MSKSKFFQKVLRPTKQRSYNSNIFGFDIETFDKNRKFYCASVYHRNPRFCQTFFDKKQLLEHFKQHRYRNSIISATNLGFDFFGTYFNTEDIMNFKLLMRGSSLLYAKTWLDTKRNFSKHSGKSKYPVTFLDTGNYAMLSVDKLGRMLKIPKLEKPSFLGHEPKTEAEKQQMIRYNMQDSKISCEAMHFLYKTFYDLGATPKITIASTSMSLFRNKYLSNDFFLHSDADLLSQFKAYYGGRVEAFSRGSFRNYYYYDYNSLYPSVMCENEFPNPNTMRKTYKDSNKYIDGFDGVSEVLIYAPYMNYPLLPHRTDGKLLFPISEWRAWYSHVELRKALDLGYEIRKVYRTIYFKENTDVFSEYVKELYAQRLVWKKEENPMEYVAKILMNSLYGKFGQKFLDKEDLQPFNHTIEELAKLKWFERVGNFIRIKKPYTPPPCFTTPIWALYVTALARLKLYTGICKSKPIYCDTDSLITKHEMNTSNKLGKLKLEMPIKQGLIVKPKFYAVTTDDKEFIRIKGVSTKMTYNMFVDLMKNPSVSYKKFTKIREALRRGFVPNEIIDITKNLSLEDNKRVWKNKFCFNKLENSEPISIVF